MPRTRSSGWDGVDSIKKSICCGDDRLSDQDISCNSSDDDKAHCKFSAKIPNLQNSRISSGKNRHDHRRHRPTKKRKTVKTKLNFSVEDNNVCVFKDVNEISNGEHHTNNSSPIFFSDDESNNKPMFDHYKDSFETASCANFDSILKSSNDQDRVDKNSEEISSPILKVNHSNRFKKRLKRNKMVKQCPEILKQSNTDDEFVIGTYSNSQNVSVPNKDIDDAYISSFKITPEKNSGQSLIMINESNMTNEITFTNTNKSVQADSMKKKSKKKLPADSLASRLQKLIKKQESFLSIWKHERYMATHSNFECPAESSEGTLTLKVVSCREECGIFMVECSGNIKDDDKLPKLYTVIFNNHFVKEITVGCGWTLVIYKPYKIFDIDNTDSNNLHTVIVNVCKFDLIQC